MTVDGVEACGGYNITNTATWALLLGLLLLWAYRLLAELGETMDTELTISIVPYLLWGSVYHVLEDADLFAPFTREEPGSSFFDQYLGAFFITPLIWVEIVLVAVLVLWIGHQSRRVGRRLGANRGLQFYGYFLLALTALYVALWVARPGFIRYLSDPLVVLVAAALSFLIAWFDARKLGHVNPRTLVLSTGVGFLFVGLFYMAVWQTRAVDAWGLPAGVEPKWWVLGALVVGMVLFTWFVRGLAKALSGPRSTTAAGERRSPSLHVVLFFLIVIVGGLLLLVSTLPACRFLDPADPTSRDGAPACHSGPLSGGPAWLGAVQLLVAPVLFYAALRLVARWAQGPLGTRPQLAVFTHPVNLLMIAGQMTDAFMTSIGTDFFDYDEKHILPRFLIGLAASLPPPFSDFATTIVMIPLKLFIVLAVVWLIDVSSKEEAASRQNLLGLIKLAILMVGLSPGVRNAVRVAMVT